MIIAAIIVIIKSFLARPKMRAAWTPSPGTPSAFAYGHDISIKTWSFIDISLFYYVFPLTPLLGLRLEKLERALLGLVARLDEVLERLLAEGVLLAADDATLVLHQVLLR